MFMTGDNQAERYQKIIRQMSQEAQSLYGKDMAYILENETEVEIPPPELEAVPAELRTTNLPAYELAMRQAELSYNVEKLEHLKDIKEYELQKQMLAGDLVGKCATSVITKLEQAPDWKKIKLEDPVEVLKRIKDIVFNYKGVKNGYDLIHSSAKGLSELKQRDGESTKDWAERVKTRIRSHDQHWLGMRDIPEDTKTDPLDVSDLDAFKNDKNREKALEEYMAYIIITRSHHETYQKLKELLAMQ